MKRGRNRPTLQHKKRHRETPKQKRGSAGGRGWRGRERGIDERQKEKDRDRQTETERDSHSHKDRQRDIAID